jgi:hypothetical protein
MGQKEEEVMDTQFNVIWEWVRQPIKMVMTGGWFIIVLPTLFDN